MNNITARGFKLTKEIEQKVAEELRKLNKFKLENKRTNVSLSTETYGQKAEISIKVDGGDFRAESTNSDLYIAIEAAVRTLTNQVRRHLDISENNGKASIRFSESENQVVIKNSSEPQIVKRKEITVKPMFETEAILQMELLGHRSFLFYNADTESPCMIYKRHDGDYGIIEST